MPRRFRATATTLAIVMVVATVSAGCGGSATPATPTAPEAPRSGLDQAGFDRGVRPQDDLYQFTNGTWLRNNQIPPDQAEVSTFSTLAQRSEENQRALIEAAADPGGDKTSVDASQASNARKVSDMYASFMDTATLDRLRAIPLAADFAAVDRLANQADLVRYLGEIQRIGVSNPIGLGVGQDDRNATAYITEASQSGLELPDRNYYLSTDPKFVAIRDKYRTYVATMLKMAGLPDPDGSASRILDLETQLAKAQWTNVQLRDPLAGYNKFAVADATVRAPGLDWSAYLDAAGFKVPELLIGQPSFFTALGTLLSSVSLNVWKQYLKWHLLADAAPYLSLDFVATRFDFVGKVLSGRQQDRERWRRGVAAVNSAMAEAVGQLYVQRYFAPDAKQRMERLVGNLIEAYQHSIDTLDWMSPATKSQAHDKLSKLSAKIGYPAKWRDYSKLEISRTDLIGNVRRAAQLAYQRAVDKLGKPVDRDEWEMSPQTVNAYYNPTMNEIVFPAGILQPPFFDVTADDAVNYGAIGGVIGHEISHGFDDQGRHYDGTGNLRDWWTPEDAQRFTAKTSELVQRYNSFSPLPGTHVNGELTLGENIADLSGLTVAFRAYQASLGGKLVPMLDGFTGDQRFFLGYAQIWRAKKRDEALRQSLLTDPHSPGLFRTNGVVNNLDGFYTAFNVKPGDRMYLPASDRTRIW
ncbi:MAG: peptidase M13 [Pseudonocardia sp.]|nr:peptidase M13 [Pseudonocardia sp.]